MSTTLTPSARWLRVRVPLKAIESPRQFILAAPFHGPWPLTAAGCRIVSASYPLWCYPSQVLALVISEEDAALLALQGVAFEATACG